MPGQPSDLPPGFVVGEYRIDRVIGRGGMGTVYAAVQPLIEKKVAIKVLGTQWASTPELVRRFVDEARAVNRIGHENIIDIFSFGQLGDGRHYFVMELLQGATLGERLEKGDLAREEIAPLLVQVCDALEAAHGKKIVHRDLKLDNVWVAPSARGRLTVRLLDFGIAKLLETGDRMTTDAGAVMGTPQYMSPEQCHGTGVDHRTDIYAMGVMLYRVYAGRLPFQGETFAEILCKQLTDVPPPPSTYAPLPSDLDRLIMSCLEKDPERRPQSAGALAAALTALASAPGSSRSVSAVPVRAAATSTAKAVSTERLGAAAAAAEPARPRRLGLLLLGAGVAVTVAAAAGWRARHHDPAPSAVAPPTPAVTRTTTAVTPPSAAVVVPGPPPPSMSPVPVVAPAPPVPDRSAAKVIAKHHVARATAAARPPEPTPPLSPSSKASSKGLATDNPFR